MNIRTLIALMMFCVVAWSGCSKRAELGTASSKEITRFMIINASPTAPVVDVYIDKIRSAEELGYQKSKGYISMLAGNHELSVFTANATENPIATQKLDLKAEKNYTILIVGSGKSMKLLTFEDDNSQPPTGKARIRFINTISDVPAVDLRVVTTDKILSKNIAPFNADKYKELNSGAYELAVNLEGLTTPVAGMVNTELKSRGVYTIVAMGNVSAGNSAMAAYQDR